MNKKIILIVVVLGNIFLHSCEILPTEINNKPIPDNIINIPWKLTSATMGNTTPDLSTYDTFHFLIGDTLVYGDDGCNKYYGKFERRGDIMEITSMWQTQIACNSMLYFDPCHLIGRWNVKIDENMLTVSQPDTVFVFSSEFTESVDKYPLTDKTWILRASNDTTFHILQKYDLLPELQFTQNREFAFRWYFTPRNPIFQSNLIGGAFGVTPQQSIYFYPSSTSYTSPNEIMSMEDHRLVRRITESTHFSFSDKSLTLFKEDNGLYYEFAIKD